MQVKQKQKLSSPSAGSFISKQYQNGYRFIVVYLLFAVGILSLGSIIIYPMLGGTLLLGAAALFCIGLLVHALKDMRRQGRE